MKKNTMLDLGYNEREYYCARIFGEFHKTWDFKLLDSIISEDCVLDTGSRQYKGKNEIMYFYLFGKRMVDYAFYQMVQLTGTSKKVQLGDGIFGLPRYYGGRTTYDEGKVCVLISQMFKIQNGITTTLVIINLDKKGLINEIFLENYQKYALSILQRTVLYKTKKWGSGIPKYNITDTLDEAEMSYFSMDRAINWLKNDGYTIGNCSYWLDEIPNIFAVNKESGKKVVVLVRGIDKSEEDLEYEKVFIHKRLRNIYYRDAERKGAEFYIWLGYFQSVDEERRKNNLLLVGDRFRYHGIFLEPGDFEVE